MLVNYIPIKKKQTIPKKITKGKILLNLFHEASITLIPKVDKDITKKGKLQDSITDEHDAKMLNKYMSNLNSTIY